jgi:hypothetical protein
VTPLRQRGGAFGTADPPPTGVFSLAEILRNHMTYDCLSWDRISTILTDAIKLQLRNRCLSYYAK